MATNAPRSLQVFDPVLTGLARSYRPKGFIARQLLPSIPTSKLSGQYPVFTKAFWFQNDVDTLISDRAGTKEVDFEWSTEPYLCREYGLKVGWSDLEADQAIEQLKFEQSKTEFLTQRMEMSYEVRVANLLRKSGNTATAGLNLGATPSVNWDQDTATIEADIKTGVLAIYDATGLTPNKMIIPFKVAYAMALQEDIRAILRYDATGEGRKFLQIGDRALPAVIHDMDVIVPKGAQTDSSNEGGTSSVSEIWGDHVRLLYADTSAGWGIPSVAYRVEHTPKKVTRWRTVDPDLNYVREMERFDLKVVAPDCGYELTALLS